VRPQAYTKPEKSPNMAGMVNHFNSISNWAASLIVLETNQQKRAQLLVQFILAAWVRHPPPTPPQPTNHLPEHRRALLIIAWVAFFQQECRLIHNFNGSYAIVAALNNAAISRLKQTWAVPHTTHDTRHTHNRTRTTARARGRL